MPLAVELVDRVVSERIDEDVAGATDDHVIGRRQGRKANPGGVEDPECAALVGNEDPPVRINCGSDRTHHAARDLRGRLAVGGDPPDHAVRAVRHDDVATGREEIAQGI